MTFFYADITHNVTLISILCKKKPHFLRKIYKIVVQVSFDRGLHKRNTLKEK